MTAKEKALELINKYKNAPFNCKDCDMPFCDVPCTMLSLEEAKQCALIAIEEILYIVDCTSPQYDFWKQVKKEIEKL